MKVLLFDPPFYRFIGYYNRYFPLGLSYLASVLCASGHEVLIYDADYNAKPSKTDFSRLEDDYPAYLKSLSNNKHHIWKEIKDSIEKFSPDVVGISIWTTYAASAFKIASLCKSLNYDLPIIMGGPHVSIKYNEVMEICPEVDFLVRGEGEKTFSELINAISKKHRSFNDIKGISYRDNNKIIHNAAREFIEDLDSIPLPGREFLLNKTSYNAEDMGLIMTSRGCPYNCSFCATSIWERKVRYRSINNVIKEIELVKNKYGTKQFTLKDDSFTVNRKRVLEFCDKLTHKRLRINWDCNTRANLVDEELLIKMKQAGCNSIKIGIETGSERISQLMNKGITLEHCRKAATLLRKANIHWTGYFMIGLPTETKEDINKTLSFMKELRPDYASLSVYEPFPGTELFNVGIEKDLVEERRNLDNFYTVSPKYYYVKDLSRRIDTMSIEEFQRLEAEIKKAFHQYNMGFSRLAKRATSRSKLYLHEPKTLLSDLKKLKGMI